MGRWERAPPEDIGCSWPSGTGPRRKTPRGQFRTVSTVRHLAAKTNSTGVGAQAFDGVSGRTGIFAAARAAWLQSAGSISTKSRVTDKVATSRPRQKKGRQVTPQPGRFLGGAGWQSRGLLGPGGWLRPARPRVAGCHSGLPSRSHDGARPRGGTRPATCVESKRQKISPARRRLGMITKTRRLAGGRLGPAGWQGWSCDSPLCCPNYHVRGSGARLGRAGVSGTWFLQAPPVFGTRAGGTMALGVAEGSGLAGSSDFLRLGA